MMAQALILVPGLGADQASWQHQVEHLADIADMTVADLKKCGSRGEMADAVLQAAPERFALAGQSMGGWVAQEVAARAPERVTRLALLNTWARPDPEFNDKQRDVIRRIDAGQFSDVLDEHIPRILHPDRVKEKDLVKTIQAMLNAYDSRDCLAKITVPTLVIAGRQDPIFSVEEHKFLAATIPGARMAIIEDCGHAAPLERPQAVTALLRYWLTYF
jgi:pimeloyl-ACP methyl ester carboxylesterase